jgi:hypothetical protein
VNCCCANAALAIQIAAEWRIQSFFVFLFAFAFVNGER